MVQNRNPEGKIQKKMVRTYSPFDKVINDLRPADLTILRTVHEGWYVEYKGELINASALAKAVSAFANTYGGWLFLGVKEQSRDDSVAGEFPGIPEAAVDGALQRLRQSTAMYLNPTPFFETKVIPGPCVEIGLAEGRSVVAIEIQESHTAPHVHKDGRIYRRVADGSEPKPETDRFILDQLWRRADPILEMTREWVERDPEFSKGEAENPYVRLLLCVDPWCERDPRLLAPFSEIRKILTICETDTSFSSIAFDTVHPTAEGIIARQAKGNNPRDYGLTWRMRRDMSCDIVMPLPLYACNDPDSLILDLDGYDHSVSFINILKEQGHAQPRIVDLNFIMVLLISIVSKYQRLLQLANAKGEFYFKARVLNAWRILPFIDVETVLGEFKAHGMPMIMDSTVTIPIGATPRSFARIHERETKGSEYNEKAASMTQALLMFTRIATAFGVTLLAQDETKADDTNDMMKWPLTIPYSELTATGVRAMTAQQNRKKRLSET